MGRVHFSDMLSTHQRAQNWLIKQIVWLIEWTNECVTLKYLVNSTQGRLLLLFTLLQDIWERKTQKPHNSQGRALCSRSTHIKEGLRGRTREHHCTAFEFGVRSWRKEGGWEIITSFQLLRKEPQDESYFPHTEKQEAQRHVKITKWHVSVLSTAPASRNLQFPFSCYHSKRLMQYENNAWERVWACSSDRPEVKPWLDLCHLWICFLSRKIQWDHVHMGQGWELNKIMYVNCGTQCLANKLWLSH